MKKFLFFCIAIAFALSITAFASEKLSPAIDVIALDNSVIKAGVIYNGEMGFDAYDFDNSIGVNVKSIKITSLPNDEAGKLMLGNLYVVENQVIKREDFSALKFVSKSAEASECVFKFIPSSGSYEIECVLRVLNEVNYSPIATNGEIISAWTNADTSQFGVLSGSDPEGDKIKFEIVSYPEKGLVEITNPETGDYKYTPYASARGSDSFSYRVRDEHGNYSANTTVKMKIEKLKTTLVFSDMSGHKSLNAVYEISERYMSCEKNSDGTYSFNPDKAVTTEEFLSLVMDVMGAKDVPTIEKTRFADDSSIDSKYKGYFESAFSLGIISGERKNDGIYVNPKSEITTAQAAVIISKIIGIKDSATTMTFADTDEIPEWAIASVTSLCELGILEQENGKISPNSPLTRAQTARILMSLLEYRGKINH